jgi:hypothetical protein
MDEPEAEMKKSKIIADCGLAFFALVVLPANAAITCQLNDFSIETYHHKGVYVHGTIAGQAAQWIVLCGDSAGQFDCDSKATDRNLAVALSAQAEAKSLWIYFETLGSCLSIPPYTQATSLKITP